MDPQVQASFIPKSTLDIAAPRGSGFGGLIFLIALLFFVASLVSAGAAFGYTKYLNTAIDQKSHQLTLAEGAFDPGVIVDLSRIDTRLTQAKTLLGKHIAVSGIFTFLSSQTLPTVAFSSFTYALGADGSAKITMLGVADSFATVALQSDQFDGNKMLKDVDFTGISSDPISGRIQFNVSATLDSGVLAYANTLGAAAPVQPIDTAPAAVTPASTTPAGAPSPAGTPK